MSFIQKISNIVKTSPFIKNSLALFVGTMGGNMLNYVFQVMVGRMVSVQDYGEITSLTALLAIVIIPAAALTMVITKYAAHTKADNDSSGAQQLFGSVQKKVILIGLPVFAILFFSSGLVADFLRLEDLHLVWMLWIMVFFTFLSALTSGILTGWQQFQRVGFVTAISAAAKLIFGYVFIVLGFAAAGAVGGFVVGTIVAYLSSRWFLRNVFVSHKNSDVDFAQNSKSKKVSPPINIDIRGYVLPVLVGMFAVTILGNIDMVMAKHKLDAITAGYFGALTITSKVIFFATGIIATVLFSMSAEGNYKKEVGHGRLWYAVAVMAVLSACALFVYALFPQFVLMVLFGGKYEVVAHLLWIFAVLVIAYSFANLLLVYLLSVQRTNIAFFYGVVAIIEIVALYFKGYSLYAIMVIAIGAQLICIVGALIVLLSPDKAKKTRQKKQGTRKILPKKEIDSKF